MATVYTNALYSSINLGVPTSSYFSLSSSGNELVLAVPGTFNGVSVVGVAYNLADWAGAGATTRRTLTINTYSSGASAGNNTTLTTGVSSSGGLTFALILADRRYIDLTYSGATLTYAADLSAATTNVSDPNKRRLFTLGII